MSTRSSRAASSNLDLCAELGRLAPFGLGNPGVLLLVDGCELADLSTVGDGKHLRFRVRQRGRDSGSAIAFGMGGQLDRFRRDRRYDIAFRLQENHWNGVSSPQLVVRRVFDAPDGFDELRDWLGGQWQAGEAAWTPQARLIFEELELTATARAGACSSRPRSGRCSKRDPRSPRPPRRCPRPRPAPAACGPPGSAFSSAGVA